MSSNYCGAELFAYDVFRLDKKATALTISSPLELVTVSSSISSECLHALPAVAAGTKQPVDVTASASTVIQHQQVHEPISPLCTNNVGHQLPTNSPQRLVLHSSQSTSDTRTSPIHKSAPQQPIFTLNSDLVQISQADRGSSTNQMTHGTEVPIYSRPVKHHVNQERISPPVANNKERQLPTDLSYQHLLQYPYPRQVFDSPPSPMYASAPHQPVYSPHNDVSRTSQAVTSPSPHQMSGSNEPVYSGISQRTAPVKSFVPPAEQHVYARPSLNQKHIPVIHQNSEPAVKNYDRYRRHDPTLVYCGLDPYRQQMPPVTQPRLPMLTSDVGGMHQQRNAGRSSSWREQPPAANYEVVYNNSPPVQAHRSNSHREMPAVRSEQGQYGDRMLPFGNGLSPRPQNMLMNDPYRRHHPAFDGANYFQHDRVRVEPVLNRDRDLNMKNRLRMYGAEDVNDNTAARVPGIPASHRLSTAAGGPPQYSVPAYPRQPNSDLYRYPSPTYFVENSLSPRPLPPATRQPDDLRNPSAEAQYNFRSRQVCTESSVMFQILCYGLVFCFTG